MQRIANVLVLMGGPDAEREVSIMSGREVAQALRDARRFQVVDRVIDRPGLDELASVAAETGCDVIFPVLHGHWGEGGPLQEMLEAIAIPYIGSGSRSAGLAMDKIETKSNLSRLKVPTPCAMEIGPDDSCPIDPPLVLKPVDDGSSVDLRICLTNEQISEARTALHSKRPRLMAEEYVRGREITVGILHGKPLPLIEIVPATEFYDYEAKYTRDDTRYVIDPHLPLGMAEDITRMAVLAFETLGCRDIARVDFMVDDRGPWFLEINTMPGFTTHSLVPMAAASIGLNMSRICSDLVDAALDRTCAKAQAAARA